MKYLFLILTGWVSFLMTDCSTPQEKGKAGQECWFIFADVRTDEVLAINIDHTDMKFVGDKTKVFYSKNDGKYIPMTIESFEDYERLSLLYPGENLNARLLVNFPAKPKETYRLDLHHLMSPVAKILCTDSKDKVQEFYCVDQDSIRIPTYYGTKIFPKTSEDFIIPFMDDKGSGEGLILFGLNKKWHLLYQYPNSEKYIELNMISKNPSNASLIVVFPNDKSRKYKIKFRPHPLYLSLFVFNPDGSEQQFINNTGFLTDNKSPVQMYQELLGK